MASPAQIRHLQRLFTFFKRNGGNNIPPGVSQIELLDDDDLCSWFVQLVYKDENNEDFFVSLELSFVGDEEDSAATARHSGRQGSGSSYTFPGVGPRRVEEPSTKLDSQRQEDVVVGSSTPTTPLLQEKQNCTSTNAPISLAMDKAASTGTAASVASLTTSADGLVNDRRVSEPTDGNADGDLVLGTSLQLASCGESHRLSRPCDDAIVASKTTAVAAETDTGSGIVATPPLISSPLVEACPVTKVQDTSAATLISSMSPGPAANVKPSLPLNGRLPLVFIIAPRLVASFIHHGALCSLELMTQQWDQTPENVVLLLIALHETLNPFSGDGRVSIDDPHHATERRAIAIAAGGVVAEENGPQSSGGGGASSPSAYSDEEHRMGIDYIRRAHPHLFRKYVVGVSATAEVATAAAAASVAAPATAEASLPYTSTVDALASQSCEPHTSCDSPVAGDNPPFPMTAAHHVLETVSHLNSAVYDALVSTTAVAAAAAAGAGASTQRSPHFPASPVEETLTARNTDTKVTMLLRMAALLGDTDGAEKDGSSTPAVQPVMSSPTARSPQDTAVEDNGSPVGTIREVQRRSTRGVAMPFIHANRVLRARPPALYHHVSAATQTDLRQRVVELWIPFALPPERSSLDDSLDPTHSRASPGEAASMTKITSLKGDRSSSTLPAPHSPELRSRQLHVCLIGDNGEEVAQSPLACVLRNMRVTMNSTRTSTWAAAGDESPASPSSPSSSMRFTLQPSTAPSPSGEVHLCIIPRGVTLECRNMYLYGRLQVLGSLVLHNCVFVGSLTTEEFSTVQISHSRLAMVPEERLFVPLQPCLANLRSTNDSAPPLPSPPTYTQRKESILILDSSRVDVTDNSFIYRLTLDSVPPTAVALQRSLILVSNQGRLRLVRCTIHPCVNTERTIFAEQDAIVDMAYCEVVAATSSAISIQGCRAFLEHCRLIGSASASSSSSSVSSLSEMGPPILQVNDRSRSTGLNVELGGTLTARWCVAQHLYFGFCVIAHSVAHLYHCHAGNVVNGYTIDASTATLECCTAVTNHVGVFVLRKAKCNLMDDCSGSFARRCAILGEVYSAAQHTMAEEETGVEPMTSRMAQAYVGRLARQLYVERLLDSDNTTGTATQRPTVDQAVAQHVGISGGRFSLEVRDAVLKTTGMTLLNARDTALYAYENSVVQLEECVMWLAEDAPHVVFDNRTDAVVGQSLDDRFTRSRRVSSPLLPHSRQRSCGVKVVHAVLEARRCLVVNYSFGIAAIQSAEVQLQECLVLCGTNGYTVDGSRCHMRHCGADTSHVGIFALNNSVVEVQSTPHVVGVSASSRTPPPLICGGIPAVYSGDVYGVEIQSSHMKCVGVTVLRGRDSGFNAYGGSTLNLFKCLVDMSPIDAATYVFHQSRPSPLHSTAIGADPTQSATEPSSSARQRGKAEDAMNVLTQNWAAVLPRSGTQTDENGASGGTANAQARTSGVKVWSGSTCYVQDTEVRCVTFGYAALGPETKLEAHHCTAKHLVNGFTADGGTIQLTKCSVSSNHVGVYILSHGRCIIRRGSYTAKKYGIECHSGVLTFHGHVKVYGFSRIGLYLYDGAHCEANAESILDIHAVKQRGSGPARAANVGDEGLPLTSTMASICGPESATTVSDLLPACVALDEATAILPQAILGGSACCGVTCADGATCRIGMCIIQDCSLVGVNVFSGAHLTLANCVVNCARGYAVMVHNGGVCKIERQDDDNADVIRGGRTGELAHGVAAAAAPPRTTGYHKLQLLSKILQSPRRLLRQVTSIGITSVQKLAGVFVGTSPTAMWHPFQSTPAPVLRHAVGHSHHLQPPAQPTLLQRLWHSTSFLRTYWLMVHGRTNSGAKPLEPFEDLLYRIDDLCVEPPEVGGRREAPPSAADHLRLKCLRLALHQAQLPFQHNPLDGTIPATPTPQIPPPLAAAAASAAPVAVSLPSPSPVPLLSADRAASPPPSTPVPPAPLLPSVQPCIRGACVIRGSCTMDRVWLQPSSPRLASCAHATSAAAACAGSEAVEASKGRPHHSLRTGSGDPPSDCGTDGDADGEAEVEAEQEALVRAAAAIYVCQEGRLSLTNCLMDASCATSPSLGTILLHCEGPYTSLHLHYVRVQPSEAASTPTTTPPHPLAIRLLNGAQCSLHMVGVGLMDWPYSIFAPSLPASNDDNTATWYGRRSTPSPHPSITVVSDEDGSILTAPLAVAVHSSSHAVLDASYVSFHRVKATRCSMIRLAHCCLAGPQPFLLSGESVASMMYCRLIGALRSTEALVAVAGGCDLTLFRSSLIYFRSELGVACTDGGRVQEVDSEHLILNAEHPES